jgi:hypothetical protein
MAAAFGHHRGVRGDALSNFLYGRLTDAIVLHGDERRRTACRKIILLFPPMKLTPLMKTGKS